MSSKIEQQIDQIEDYIDSCRYQTFSKTNIIVDKDELDGLLEELRARTPEEIKHYQRIINNKDAILEDARRKAEEMINEATVHTNELVNEHEIMQQAYAQANEIVRLATQQGQDILDKAISEANAYRSSAAQYMEDMLAQIEQSTVSARNNLTSIFSNFHAEMSDYIDTVHQNRAELIPQDDDVGIVVLDDFRGPVLNQADNGEGGIGDTADRTDRKGLGDGFDAFIQREAGGKHGGNDFGGQGGENAGLDAAAQTVGQHHDGGTVFLFDDVHMIAAELFACMVNASEADVTA